MNILIVGGDSMIGKHLREKLKFLNINYYASTKDNKQNLKANFLHINLANFNENWAVPMINWDWIIMCAGISTIKDCEDNPDWSRFINVNQSIALLEKLVSKGSSIFFFSTSLVFDKNNEFPNLHNTPNPICEYAKQKYEVENYLINNFKNNYIVLRLSKVLDSNSKLINNWISNLKDNQMIYPFKDSYIYPVFIDNLIDLIIHLIYNSNRGTYNFSGISKISYSKIAFLIAKTLDLDESLIKPIQKLNKHNDFGSTNLENSFLCKPFVEDYIIGLSQLYKIKNH